MYYREFEVGDKVMVVNEPYLDCPFTWVDNMDEMCGKLVTIKDKSYDSSHRTFVYKVAGSSWSWCGNCFVLQEPEEELPEIEDEAFLNAIHMVVGKS